MWGETFPRLKSSLNVSGSWLPRYPFPLRFDWKCWYRQRTCRELEKNYWWNENGRCDEVIMSVQCLYECCFGCVWVLIVSLCFIVCLCVVSCVCAFWLSLCVFYCVSVCFIVCLCVLSVRAQSCVFCRMCFLSCECMFLRVYVCSCSCVCLCVFYLVNVCSVLWMRVLSCKVSFIACLCCVPCVFYCSRWTKANNCKMLKIRLDSAAHVTLLKSLFRNHFFRHFSRFSSNFPCIYGLTLSHRRRNIAPT